LGTGSCIRTFAAVALGACVFALIDPAGDTRVAAQIASGIGFLGARVIIRGRAHVHGLTTAASLWAMASIGAEIAYEHYLMGIAVTIFLVVLLATPTKKKEPEISLPKSNAPIASVRAVLVPRWSVRRHCLEPRIGLPITVGSRRTGQHHQVIASHSKWKQSWPLVRWSCRFVSCGRLTCSTLGTTKEREETQPDNSMRSINFR
jgi:hypothetical protein